MKSPPGAPSGVTNELAKERNRAAAERTLTSWIGNCLSLIGFGLAFDRIIGALDRSRGIAVDNSIVPFIALTTIGLGVFLLIVAIGLHHSEMLAFERPGEQSTARLTLVSAGAVVLLGLVALAASFIRVR